MTKTQNQKSTMPTNTMKLPSYFDVLYGAQQRIKATMLGLGYGMRKGFGTRLTYLLCLLILAIPQRKAVR